MPTFRFGCLALLALLASIASSGPAAAQQPSAQSQAPQSVFGEQIEVCQGEEIGRPSVLLVRPEAAGGRVTAVHVGGSAVIVARGELLA